MNPIGNVFCSRCNTRLLSIEMQLPEKPKPVEELPVGVKGISLPTLQTAKDGALEPEELPDWLLELTEQPLGKPAESSEPAQADQFPDWLSGIVNESENVFTTEDAPMAASEEIPGELPDWFSELVAGAETPEEAVPEETAASATPDWFADLLEDETAGVAGVEVETASILTPVEEEPALEALPDWLSDLTPEEPAVAPAADAFDMAPPPPTWEAAAPAPEPVADFAEAPRADLPNWLLATAVPTPSGEVAASQPMPEWLLENVEESMPGQEPGGQKIPAWLMKDAEPGVPVVPRVPASPRPTPVEVQERARSTEVVSSPLFVEEPGEEAAPVGVPGVGASDWLANLYPEEELEPQAVMPATEREEEPAEAMPDWLLGMYDEEEVEPQAAAPAVEPAAEGAPEAGVSEASVPDWLLGLYDEEEIEPQAAGPVVELEGEVGAPEMAAPETGVPDWLASIYSGEEAEPPTAAFTVEPEEEAGASEAGVPDWLAGIYSEEEAEASTAAFTTEPEEEEVVLGAGVPDWLAGIMAEEPVPMQPQVSSEEAAAALATDVPDWLAGLAEAPSAREEQPGPFAADRSIFTKSAPEEPPPTSSATPEWLKGVTPVDEELALKPAQPAFIHGEVPTGALEEGIEEPVLEEGEIPDWLKGLSPAAPSPVEEEAAFLERVSEDESLVRAEVPSWLQGLRPPGTGPLPPLPEVMAPGAEVPLPQEGGLVRAEIPDWVQQLRPVPSAEGEAGEKRALEPAETEGPLAGLRGVLPAGALVDMPVDFEPVPPPPIPDSIVAQAQLWQRLLEQPRSVQRPVAQHHVRSGSGQMAMRWIVTVVLLAVTALGLLWSNAPLSQARSNSHIEHFSKAIDALQAGDTVIVAVEYGPAEAGEMTALAEAVVQHLADRNARVMMVSTLPEGAGLIHGLLEPMALANRLPAGQVAYLPGSSSGVAQFLTEPSDAKMLIVLAGRAERLRWWVEQNNAKATVSAPPLPMHVAVNAATAPLAIPYLETLPVEGWIAGFSDVTAYQEFRGLTSSVRNSELNALMLAHWAALALLLFGLFYYLAMGKKGAS